MRELDYNNLKNLPEWQALHARVAKVAQDYFDELLELSKEGSINEMLDRCGRISMIRDFTMLAKEVCEKKGTYNEQTKEDSE